MRRVILFDIFEVLLSTVCLFSFELLEDVIHCFGRRIRLPEIGVVVGLPQQEVERAEASNDLVLLRILDLQVACNLG